MANLKIKLNTKNGEETFEQNFVPMRKRLEYIKQEKALTERKKPATQDEMINFQAGFVADLFDDKKVTKDAILDGVDINDTSIIYCIGKLLGIDLEALSKQAEEDPKAQSLGEN